MLLDYFQEKSVYITNNKTNHNDDNYFHVDLTILKNIKMINIKFLHKYVHSL